MTEVWQDVQASKWIQDRKVKVRIEMEMSPEDAHKLLKIQGRLNEIDSDARVRGGVIFFGRVPLWFRLLSPILKLYWRLT